MIQRNTHIARVAQASLAILLLAFLTARAQDDDLTQEEKEYGLNLLADLTRAGNGHFLLAGSIRDDQARPITNATIILEKLRLTGAWGATATEKETLSFGSNFCIDTGAYHSLHLRIRSPGHHSQKLSFSVSLSGSNAVQLMNGNSVPEPEIINTNLTITLQRIGNLTFLCRYAESLEYAASNRAVVIDLDRSHHRHASLSNVIMASSAMTLPTNCVYFVASTNGSGQILSVTLTNSSGLTLDFPESIQLSMSDTGGGFSLYAPAGDLPLHLQMREAPDSGYSQHLTLVATNFMTLLEAGFPNDLGAFYFRSRGMYGRGSYGVPLVTSDDSMVRLPIVLDIQPNASRNLETAR